MKKAGFIRVILSLSLILIVIIMIKANIKDYVSEKMEFSTEEAVDDKQWNDEVQNNLAPTVAMGEAGNEDINMLKDQLRIFLSTNCLEYLSFLPEETPIFAYEGITEYGIRSDRFALYKETIEKDIVFVNMVFVEKEAENVYIWGEEELVLIGTLDNAKMILSESQVDESYNNLNLKNMETEELLDRVMEVLMQNGYSQSNLIYDGIIEFLNRDYCMISSFDDFEDHILRKQEYYIDSRDGYIYRVEENADFLRTELYYIGNL
ncbi:MAG: hypothetical protein K2K74_16180 [Lachnospiraceae bacterium]|nr:hypothetical protein [Lachnospiraceae bacterium]